MRITAPSKILRAGLFGLVMVLGACAAPTVLNTQWSSPDFKGKPIKSILVVAVVKDTANRRTFEDAMVRQLASKGVKAEPSYRYSPDAGVMEQAKMQQAVKESGATGVLLSRVVNVSQSVKVSPGMYMGPPVGYGFGGFYGFYGGMWASSYYTPPSLYTEENVTADTRLFEAKDFFLVWSASTTTTPGSVSATAMIDQFSQLIVNAMGADGLI
ncbi:MAG: hypothetical protein ABIR94_14375 [Rubrivivax sp.]